MERIKEPLFISKGQLQADRQKTDSASMAWGLHTHLGAAGCEVGRGGVPTEAKDAQDGLFLGQALGIFWVAVPSPSKGCVKLYSPVLNSFSVGIPKGLSCSGGKVKIESRSLVSDSLWPQGLHSPWNSPGQNTELGSLSLLQRIFPTQGLNPGLPHCRQALYQLSHKGSPLGGKGPSKALLPRLQPLKTAAALPGCLHLES